MEIAEVDHHIMIHLSFDDIIAFCKATKYTIKICANKQFWIDKINYDNLVTPDPVLFDGIGGMECYYICQLITDYLKNKKPVYIKGKKNIHIEQYKIIMINHNENASNLILKYSGIDTDELTNEIVVTYAYGTFTLTFKTDVSVDKFLLNRQEFINFLFEGISTDTISI